MKRHSIAAATALLLLAAACSTSSPAETVTQNAPTSTTTAPTDESHDMADMTDAEHEAMSAADDRGFAALSNGEEHGHEVFQPISDDDRAELARQLTLAREVALQYPTVADAEAAGLNRTGPFSPGLGIHYISYGNAGGDDDGVMSDDDIRRPLAWMYDGTSPDARVVGLFYGRNSAEGEGFAGPNDTWHIHRNVCVTQGPDGVDAPLGADRDTTQDDCDAIGGTFIESTNYLLHVWVVPGYESPEGVFSHLSSAVTCDDGSYDTVDLSKPGIRKSVCLDGTE